MTTALFDRPKLERSGFAKTRLYSELRAQPAGLVDIGARWGISEVFHLAAELFDAIGFEADPAEAGRLIQSVGEDAAWARLRILPVALADARRPITLNLLRRPNNSSMFPVERRWEQRYSLAGFELEQQIEVPAVPLDDVIFEELKDSRAGEILKIDVQGAELLILQGSERTLTERTLCIVCEVHFFTVYKDVPFFSEIELELRRLGFSFYGFLDLQERSTHRLDKRHTRGRERFMQADAVFFKDPIALGTTDARANSIIVLAATLLGFYDFALEVASLLPGGEQDIGAAIRRLAAVPTDDIAQEVAAVNRRIARDPANAAVHLGRLVDSLRDVHTYHDVKLADENGCSNPSPSRTANDAAPEWPASDTTTTRSPPGGIAPPTERS